MADTKRVTVSQTDYEVKIVINLLEPTGYKPVVVVLKDYVKFNYPPNFFEAFLAGEVHEADSVCRIFNNQARIFLKKKEHGMWPHIVEQLSKEEMQKRKTVANKSYSEKTQTETKKREEQFDAAKKEKLQYQIDREMSIHDKLKDFKKAAIAETLSDTSVKSTRPLSKNISSSKSTTSLRPKSNKSEQFLKSSPSRTSMVSSKSITNQNSDTRKTSSCMDTTAKSETKRSFKYVPPQPVNSTRKTGKIQISFSNYSAPTPKRESQAHCFADKSVPNPNIKTY